MLRLSIIVAAAALAVVVVACGGKHSGSTDAGLDGCICDAPNPPDAPGSGSGSSALGTTCTQGSNNPQGSCPAGYECLMLTGGTNAWCTKRCSAGSADTCKQNYSGPGYPTCDLTVTTTGSGSGSGSSALYCSVTCEVSGSGSAGLLCPSPAVCNGSCPGTLACNGPLTSGSGSSVGKYCE